MSGISNPIVRLFVFSCFHLIVVYIGQNNDSPKTGNIPSHPHAMHAANCVIVRLVSSEDERTKKKGIWEITKKKEYTTNKTFIGICIFDSDFILFLTHNDQPEAWF